MENATYRILLIEDDELDQMAFKRHLKAENLPYEYVVVPSISEAQSVLSSETFDIILTDFTLGDGTALDILDRTYYRGPRRRRRRESLEGRCV